MNFARLDLKFSSKLGNLFYLVPTINYDMVGKTGQLIIRTTEGIEKLNESGANAGISVIDHTLNDYLRYSDGSILEPGETVKAYKVNPDLTDKVIPDPLNKSVARYWFGFISDPGADDSWGVQGYWEIWPDSYPVPNSHNASVNSVQIGGQVQVGVFFPGTQGIAGPPSEEAVSSVFGRTGAVVAQTGDYTPQQVGADPSADNKKIINSIDDLPVPQDIGNGHGVAHNLEPGIDYDQRVDLVLAYPIVASVPGQSNSWRSSLDKTINYTGDGACFRSNNAANWVNFVGRDMYVIGDGSNASFDLEGDGTQSFFVKFSIFENFASCPSVRNYALFDFDDSAAIGFTTGFYFFEVADLIIRGKSPIIPSDLMTGACITVEGGCEECGLSCDGSRFYLLGNDQYAFDIKSIYAGVFSIFHSSVDTIAGGSAFAPGSLDHTTVTGSVFSNPTGIPESQYIGSLYMERNTLVTTISEVGQDGDILAFDDLGGGTVLVRSPGHGLTDGTVVWIVDDTYTGKYTISNVTLNTFDITAPYSGPSTGAWETGWVKVEGVTYPRENQRFYMSGNNQLTCIDPQERAYLVHCPITPANELVSATKDWEFCLMKGGNIRVRGSLSPIQMTNKAVSGNITAETRAKLGDTFEVYARGKSDTTNLIMVGMSNVIK